jgi:hypothetical protein
LGRIRKSYFTLDELLGGGGFSEADLRYGPKTALLRLSVRVVGLLMEFGSYEQTMDGEWVTLAGEHRYHDGLLDLGRRDLHTLFREGAVETRHFPDTDGGYASLLRGGEVVAVRRRRPHIRH